MDAELVNRIAEQVARALGQQGGPVMPQPRGKTAPLADDVAKQPPAKLFITADMLKRRLSAGANGGSIELEWNEFLTPNAVDFADARHVAVKKKPRPIPRTDVQVDASATAKPQSEPSPRGRIGLVIERADEKVRSLLAAIQYDLAGIEDFSGGNCLVSSVRSLCDAVSGGRLCCGVAILPYAADAMVLANKMPGIRAVQGTRLASVQAALRHFDANVLVLEHAFSTFHEMRSMMRVFAAQRTAAKPGEAFMRALADVEQRR